MVCCAKEVSTPMAMPKKFPLKKNHGQILQKRNFSSISTDEFLNLQVEFDTYMLDVDSTPP